LLKSWIYSAYSANSYLALFLNYLERLLSRAGNFVKFLLQYIDKNSQSHTIYGSHFIEKYWRFKHPFSFANKGFHHLLIKYRERSKKSFSFFPHLRMGKRQDEIKVTREWAFFLQAWLFYPFAVYCEVVVII